MVSINERFMDFQIAQQIRWIRLQNREVREALRTLRATENSLKRTITDAAIGEGNFTQARLNGLRAQVTNLISELELKLTPILHANVVDAAGLSAEVEEAAFRRILPAGVDVSTPNLGVLQTAVAASPFNGGPVGAWTKAFHRSLTATTWGAIIDGVTEGATSQDIVRGLLGTAGAKFKDGALQARRRGLETLVRTSINHATNQGRQKVWEKNSDILKGVMWVATLDNRTSPICQQRDGKVGPVVDSPDWKPPSGRDRLDPPFARPPAHPNCRSTTVAVTKSWKELGFNVKEMPEGTRASMNGQVPAKTTYYEWLKTQGSKTQKDVLGPERYALWKSGDVKIDKFVNSKGDLLTLAQIRERSIVGSPRTIKAVSTKQWPVLANDPVNMPNYFEVVNKTSMKTPANFYVQSGNDIINQHLRTGKAVSAKDLKMLDTLTTSERTRKDMALYRGQWDPKTELGVDFRSAKIGDVFDDPAFLSTTTSRDIAEQFAGVAGPGTPRAIIKIQVPEGTAVSRISRSTGLANEFEVLLSRGNKFEILAIKKGPIDEVTVRLVTTKASQKKAMEAVGVMGESSKLTVPALKTGERMNLMGNYKQAVAAASRGAVKTFKLKDVRVPLKIDLAKQNPKAEILFAMVNGKPTVVQGFIKLQKLKDSRALTVKGRTAAKGY